MIRDGQAEVRRDKSFADASFAARNRNRSIGHLSVSPLNRQCRAMEMGLDTFRFKFVVHLRREKCVTRSKRQGLERGESEAAIRLQVISVVAEGHALDFAV